MKKLLVLLVLVAIPVLAFADLQLGGVAMYKGGFPPSTPITVNDFTFGAEARVRLGLLQGAASLLYYPSAVPPASIVALTDIGLNLNLGIADFGAGIGPNFAFPINSVGSAMRAGLNLKLAGEVNLGRISLGAVGYYYLDSLKDLSLGLFKVAKPWLGLTALVKLF